MRHKGELRGRVTECRDYKMGDRDVSTCILVSGDRITRLTQKLDDDNVFITGFTPFNNEDVVITTAAGGLKNYIRIDKDFRGTPQFTLGADVDIYVDPATK